MPLIGWKVSHFHMHNTYHSAELLQILVVNFRTVKQNSPNQANPGPRSGFHPDYDTTHLATGASLSLGHVFETVFRPTCATRTLHMAISGLNSKRFVLMLLPGRNETFVNCATLTYLLTYLKGDQISTSHKTYQLAKFPRYANWKFGKYFHGHERHIPYP